MSKAEDGEVLHEGAGVPCSPEGLMLEQEDIFLLPLQSPPRAEQSGVKLSLGKGGGEVVLQGLSASHYPNLFRYTINSFSPS